MIGRVPERIGRAPTAGGNAKCGQPHFVRRRHRRKHHRLSITAAGPKGRPRRVFPAVRSGSRPLRRGDQSGIAAFARGSISAHDLLLISCGGAFDASLQFVRQVGRSTEEHITGTGASGLPCGACDSGIDRRLSRKTRVPGMRLQGRSGLSRHCLRQMRGLQESRQALRQSARSCTLSFRERAGHGGEPAMRARAEAKMTIRWKPAVVIRTRAEDGPRLAHRAGKAINPVERGHIAFRTDDIEAFKRHLKRTASPAATTQALPRARGTRSSFTIRNAISSRCIRFWRDGRADSSRHPPMARTVSVAIVARLRPGRGPACGRKIVRCSSRT